MRCKQKHIYVESVGECQEESLSCLIGLGKADTMLKGTVELLHEVWYIEELKLEACSKYPDWGLRNALKKFGELDA